MASHGVAWRADTMDSKAMWYGTALLSGILLLYIGAEWLIKGAAGLGRAVGVRPLVVGLTAVAFGTSMPEFVVSAVAAVKGMSGIALGNVVGSNIANLGLILGITALLKPLVVEGSLTRRELPIMLATSLALPLLLAGGVVSRLDALILLLGAAGFTYLMARSAVPGPAEVAALEADAEAAGAPRGTGRVRLTLIALVGLILLVVGGQALVTGASGIALALGISQRVVGLTIAAIGTSAPELAASVVAALRGHPSIAVGNIVGSNIFNVLFVLGGAAAIRPITSPLNTFGFDLAVLAAISVLATLLLRQERPIGRRAGALLLACYIAYLAALVRGYS